MARKRETQSAEQSTAQAELACPECGRTFGRAAALGAHRRRAHDVAGSSRNASANGRRRSASRRRRTPASSGRANGGQRRGRSTASSPQSVNRDALLQSLFPNGIPPREDVIRDINAWLDEAQRLSQLA